VGTWRKTTEKRGVGSDAVLARDRCTGARRREIARRDQLSHHDARRRVAEVEAERRSFLNQHFRPDFEDLSLFDMVVNTGILGLDGAVSALRAAAAALPIGEVAVTQ